MVREVKLTPPNIPWPTELTFPKDEIGDIKFICSQGKSLNWTGLPYLAHVSPVLKDAFETRGHFCTLPVLVHLPDYEVEAVKKILCLATSGKVFLKGDEFEHVCQLAVLLGIAKDHIGTATTPAASDDIVEIPSVPLMTATPSEESNQEKIVGIHLGDIVVGRPCRRDAVEDNTEITDPCENVHDTADDSEVPEFKKKPSHSECMRCSKVCVNRITLLRHLCCRHFSRKLLSENSSLVGTRRLRENQCGLCRRQFPNRFGLVCHLGIRHGRVLAHLNHAERTRVSNAQCVIASKPKKGTKRTLKCPLCPYTNHFRSQMLGHLATSHFIKTLERIHSSLPAHGNDSGDLVCRVCGKSFVARWATLVHFGNTHGYTLSLLSNEQRAMIPPPGRRSKSSTSTKLPQSHWPLIELE